MDEREKNREPSRSHAPGSSHSPNDGSPANPSPASQRTTRISYSTAGEPEWIGPYRVLQQVGTGGMGVVYEAEQTEPVRRRVALKLMKWGLDSHEAVARFEAERQALALMNHPHIARVFDAGTTDQGRPFLAMEFVQGVPITQYCDRRRLSTRARLGLFVRVCDAVQHAHQKGIIHRDIKPSNVLVSDQEGEALPKMIDFGVAKATSHRLTDKTLHTQQGMFVGTPEYSSPEQAEMSGDVDTRADIYSLGMLLYELLVGRLPFDPEQFRKAGPTEMLRVIREVEPARPSTRLATLGEASAELARCRRTVPPALRRQLRGDLDWIVLKALEKDRGRRYQSATELAADVLRHGQHEPVVAGPQSAGYRLGKFVRRYRAGVAFAAALVLVLTGFAVTMGVQARRIASERNRANEEAERANREAHAAGEVTEFMVGLFQVSDPREARGNTITAREILDRGSDKIERELQDVPLLRARMLDTMGRVYQNLGLNDRAEDKLHEAFTLRRAELPAKHPDVAKSLGRLGWLRAFGQRRFAEALPLLEEALAIHKEVLGPEHVDTGWSSYYLATAQIGTGRYSDARRSLALARDVFAATLGPEHWAVAWSWNDTGMTFLNCGGYERALHAFTQALEIQKQHLSHDHPDIAVHMINVAEVLLATREYADAKPIVDEALAISEKAHDPDHPLIAFCLRCKGDERLAQGALDEAARCFERTASIQTSLWGEESDELGRTLFSMARLAEARGDFAGSQGFYRRSWTILERAYPSGHIYSVEALEAHASFLRGLDRHEEATPLEQRATAIRAKLEEACE